MPRLLNEEYELVPLDQLTPHPQNPNNGDFGAILLSVEENGFFGACVVQRSTGHILVGNHRYLVARHEGFDRIPCVWVDVDDEAALRILLADNKTARDGHDNEHALAALLAELAVTEKGLAGTGYDGDDLDAMIGRLADSSPDPLATNDAGQGEPPSDATPHALASRFSVLVECETEEQQLDALEQISALGFPVRALTV